MTIAHKNTAAKSDDYCLPCFKTAKIVVPETQSTYQCTIRELCFLSATIRLEHYIDLPTTFLLSMSSLDYSSPIKCKIRVRDGNQICVDFVNTDD